jgi:pyruvate/2-oxoglutarate dehydrogenase complex dihydrolipoamide dehydrogenase (E3) component
MDYVNIPTTVFTPLEYGAIGYSEEDSRKKFADDNIKVYHGVFKPLEWNFSDNREVDKAFCKLETLNTEK